MLMVLLPQNLPQFQGPQLDHVRVGCSSCCFSRGQVSFVHPKELVCFDPIHATCSPRIRKRI